MAAFLEEAVSVHRLGTLENSSFSRSIFVQLEAGLSARPARALDGVPPCLIVDELLLSFFSSLQVTAAELRPAFLRPQLQRVRIRKPRALLLEASQALRRMLEDVWMGRRLRDRVHS